ncbi:LysM peptidoglycan-binding domain-containing protein [Pedobacter polaris]|uniref:LysM peptidoglycan-binding domain-containing protein n=1 Tax=Pedobacter polaris TaxID=2571273 RepID=A0A4U1CWI6_9SPHI|nr:lytic transglycosylase domain-containing protein [Pedobacter polaris]TKC13106.1 LysM peptidoglycan-binding domain-containing protein [Pedobacter polaris]
MRRIILTTISFLTFLTAAGQVTLNTAKADSVLKRIAANSIPDSVHAPVVDKLLFYNQNITFKFRLDSIQKTVPLSYNEYVQNFIDVLGKQKDRMGKMLGLSNYYFPIFEKALKAYNIPEEIKYLPIIESSMNPHAISKVGATGMWQFMFSTARAYGLNMDNFVDERKDPIQASYAAAAYFRDAYEELGDWLLAIAAYNCGKGNVTRAIGKAGSRDFWVIRQYLPKETRDYVPAFIAAVYLMNYADNHGIATQNASIDFKTDTIQVNHFVALADLARAINHEESTLSILNPSYKKKIVNGTELLPKRIILPKVEQGSYAKLYDVLNNDIEVERDIILASTDDVRDLRKLKLTNKKIIAKSNTNTYKVKPGQNLGIIADLYNVEVQDLKVWNNLKSNTVVPGQSLKIYGDKSAPIVKKVLKPDFITYRVKVGDTLSGIAEKFDGATVASIKKTNGLKKATLQPGMVLKIKS